MKIKPSLTIAALASELNVSLPEGDYTSQLTKLYINGRFLMIEFSAPTVEVLINRRDTSGRP